jgi:hypothetical protein
MNGGGQTTTQSGSQKSSQTNTLPSWLLGPYQAQLGSSTNLLNQGLGATQVPGVSMLGSGMNAIAGVNPQAIGAADTGLSNILGGQYLGPAQSQMNAASPQIQALASGQYMNPETNPYLQQSYKLGLQGIQNNVDSQFGAAGRNVLAGAPIQADQASNLATQLYGGAYNTNLAAMQNAQGLASGNYNTGIGQLANAAQIAPGVTQGLYMPGAQQLSAGQTPYNLSSWYQSLLGQTAQPFGQTSGKGSSNSTSTTVNNSSPLSQIGSVVGLLGML